MEFRIDQDHLRASKEQVFTYRKFHKLMIMLLLLLDGTDSSYFFTEDGLTICDSQKWVLA